MDLITRDIKLLIFLMRQNYISYFYGSRRKIFLWILAAKCIRFHANLDFFLPWSWRNPCCCGPTNRHWRNDIVNLFPHPYIDSGHRTKCVKRRHRWRLTMPSRRRKVGTEPVENNNSPYLGSISLLSAFCFKHAVGAVPVYYWSIRCLFEIKLIFWSILLSSFEYRLCIFQRHLTHLCIHDKVQFQYFIS